MTLIDKAEALAIVNGYWQSIGGGLPEGPSDEAILDALDAISERLNAIPARGVGVKPLDWQLCAGQDGVYYHAFDPLYGRDVEAPNEATCDAIDQNRAARILAALAPTDAAHVNETPKSEHDAGNVLTDAALIAQLREIQGQAGLFASAAADRIETLAKYRDAYAEMERIATEALRKAEARAERLEAALVEHNDLLRSALAIAKREGVEGQIASTNWDAYYNRVAVVLKRHHQTANEARTTITEATDDPR